MDGWMIKQLNAELTDDRWLNGWMDGQTDWRVAEWMDRWFNGGTGR